MPYIKKYQRLLVDDEIKKLATTILGQVKGDDLRLARPGYMNYCITKLLLEVYGSTLRYADFNEIEGVLSCASKEFYRRGASPYEDSKIASEGDVFPKK
jgi:hypothetical protein